MEDVRKILGIKIESPYWDEAYKKAKEFDGKIFCDECLRKKTITCDCCGKRIY